MTVRFSTWVEADNLEEAREKLRLSLEDKRMGDKLKDIFSACVLEDPEDKKSIDLVAWCKSYIEQSLKKMEEQGVVDYSTKPEDLPYFNEESYLLGVHEGYEKSYEFFKAMETVKGFKHDRTGVDGERSDGLLQRT